MGRGVARDSAALRDVGEYLLGQFRQSTGRTTGLRGTRDPSDLVQGSADGMLMSSDSRHSADRKWERFSIVTGAVMDSLPKKEFSHRPRYFSTSEETLEIIAAEQKARAGSLAKRTVQTASQR